MKRVGFIINSRVPNPASLFQGGLLPHHLVTGWDDAGSPMSFMRFRWVAEAQTSLRYELYRPWRRYDIVVFLKSMGPHCLALARRLKAAGTRVVFEANVDYYTLPGTANYLAEMAPTPTQRENAIAITQAADAVIASSRHLMEVCREFNPHVFWVPDNVPMNIVPPLPEAGGWPSPLPLWWSGVAAKAFEFLLIEEELRRQGDAIHLHLVTDDWPAGRRKWRADERERMDSLLAAVPHTIHDFGSIGHLLSLYAGGPGLILSPRFLDNPYNFGHTEWKITLGMACGLPAVASPLPSYLDVAGRAPAGAIRICRKGAEWSEAFADARSGAWDLPGAARAAREVVEKHYSTAVVAAQHAEVLNAL